MTEETNNVDKQQGNSKRVIGRPFPKGVSGNPAGRPKGKTIKEMVRAHLDDNPEELEDFVRHFITKNRELAWQMMEGRPKESVDMEVTLPKPIMDVDVPKEENELSKDHSDKQDKDS